MERPAPKDAPAEIPDDEVLYELADLFRVFGDSTRIKILYALHDQELCVQDIAAAVGLSQSAVSHQLRVLKDSKLVRFRRTARPSTTPWTTTTCAASSRWGWSISKNDTFGKDRYIMKKTYKIDVDCANCANKMEAAAQKTPGVKNATVNFMTLKMSVEFEEGQDHKAVMQQVYANCKKVEDDCEIFGI